MSRAVVVTGASAGVGRAVARAFGERGDKVTLLGRNRDGLDAAAEEIEHAGGRALVVEADVADYEAVERAAAEAEERFGPIDVWVNNAMTTVFAEFMDIEPDEYRRATEVTYLGTVWGTRAALARMLPRDAGVVVLVGSALAYRGIPLQSAYCGAKPAVKGFFESLRCELRHRGSNVHLTMVQLPGLNTPQFDHCRAKVRGHPRPVPPIYQPEVAARAVVWASEKRRREVYVGAPTVYTILGNKLAPWLVERYLANTAFGAQQLDEAPEQKNRKGNLFEPMSGDEGAHGRFDDEAKARSLQFFLTRRRRALGLAGAAAAALTATVLRR